MFRLLIVFLSTLLPFAAQATYYKEAITFKDFNEYNSQRLFMSNAQSSNGFPLDDTKIVEIEKGSIFLGCDETGLNPWVLSKGKRTPTPLWENTKTFSSCGTQPHSKLYKINENEVVFILDNYSTYYITDGTKEGTKIWALNETINKKNLLISFQDIKQLSNGNFVFDSDPFGVAFYDSVTEDFYEVSKTFFAFSERAKAAIISEDKVIVLSDEHVYISDGTRQGFKQLESISLDKIKNLLYKTKNAFYFYEATDDAFLLYEFDLLTEEFTTVYEGPWISLVQHFGVIEGEQSLYFIAMRIQQEGEGAWPLLDLYKFDTQKYSLTQLYDDQLKTPKELKIYNTNNYIFINKVSIDSINEYFSLSKKTDDLTTVENVNIPTNYNQSGNVFLGKSESKVYLSPRFNALQGALITIYDSENNTITNKELTTAPDRFNTFMHNNELYLAHDTESATMHAGYYVYNSLSEDIDYAFTIHKGLTNSGSRDNRDLKVFDSFVSGSGSFGNNQSSDPKYNYWLMNEELSVIPVMNQSLSDGIEITYDITIDLVIDDNLFFSVGSELKDRNTFKYNVTSQQLTKLHSTIESDDDDNKINRVIGFKDNTLYVETKSRKAGLVNINDSQVNLVETPESFYMFSCANKFLYKNRRTEEIFEVLPSSDINKIADLPSSFIFYELGLVLMYSSTTPQIYDCNTERFTPLDKTTAGREIPRISPSSSLKVNNDLYFQSTTSAPYGLELYRYNSQNRDIDYIGKYDGGFDELHINSTGVYYSEFNSESNETVIFKMNNNTLTEVHRYPEEIRFIKTHSKDEKGWLFFMGTEQSGSTNTKLFIYMPEHNKIVELDLFANAPVSESEYADIDLEPLGDWEYLNGYHYIDYQTHLIGHELLILSSTCLEQLAIFNNNQCTNGFANNLPESYITHDVEAVANKYIYIPTRATDLDGDKLEYSLVGAPQWLSIDSQSGDITGSVPSNANTEDYEMEVVISDGEETVKTNQFSLKIQGDENQSTPPTTTTPTISDGGGGGVISWVTFALLILFRASKSMIKTTKSGHDLKNLAAN
ncbi:MAG: putative Ig domain-containing protein [Aliiglaciecola sp.]|uniref:putative Ig domain-containing protein n=1 Tax=Aliiglaciecola sp. TaxID=1872441 RepID=UPI0032995937